MVVLDVVHQAVDVLLEINDDATHLFGCSGVRKDGMNANMLARSPTPPAPGAPKPSSSGPKSAN